MELQVKASEYGIEESKAKDISKMFKPMLDKMATLEKEFNRISDLPISEEACKEAKTLRNKYVKVRTETSKTHKDLKEFYLKGGRFVDGYKNVQLMASQGMEAKCRKIEEHLENIEKEKVLKLSEERLEQIKAFVEEEDTIPPNLGEMIPEVWDAYLEGNKSKFEKRAEEKRNAEILESLIKERVKIIISPDFYASKEEFASLTSLSEEEFEIAHKVALSKKSIKEKEAEKVKKSKELKDSRSKLLLPYSFLLTEEEKNLDLSGITEKKFKSILSEAKAKKVADDKEKARLQKIEEQSKERERIYQAQKKKDQIEKDRLIAENKKKDDQIKESKEKAKIIIPEENIPKPSFQDKVEKLATEKENLTDEQKFNSFIKDLSVLRTKYEFENMKYQLVYDMGKELIGKTITYIQKKIK